METEKKFRRTLHRKTTGGNLTTSVFETTHKGPYIPGGTLTFTMGKWRSQIEEKIGVKENMGRWSGNTYRVTNTKKLHIITGYQVCQSQPNTTN